MYTFLQVWERAPRVDCVVNLIRIVLKWKEVAAVECDNSATVFRTSVGHKLFNCGEVVIPEVKRVTGVLLFIQRNREWNGLFNDV